MASRSANQDCPRRLIGAINLPIGARLRLACFPSLKQPSRKRQRRRRCWRQRSKNVAETKNEAWRVFCAIELPSLVHEKISEHIKRLRAAAPDSPASWGRAENVHLTLKF